MTDRPIGVALAAFGSAARVFHLPLLRSTQGLELRTIVTSRADEARAALPGIAVVPDLAEACADPGIDLVVIPTPNDTHAPLAAQALAAGKHVVVDKPFTLSVAEAKSLQDLAAARGSVLSVFQNRRWDADFLALRQVLQSGAVGEPVTVRIPHATASGPRCPTAGATAPAPVPACGTISDHIWSIRRSSCSARHEASSSTWPPSVTGLPPTTASTPCCATTACASPSTPPRSPPPRRRASRCTAPRAAGSSTAPISRSTSLKAGTLPGTTGWGHDPLPGTLTSAGGSKPVPGPPGDYGAVLPRHPRRHSRHGPNPVPPAEALAVMTVLERGRDSHEQRRELTILEMSGGRELSI